MLKFSRFTLVVVFIGLYQLGFAQLQSPSFNLMPYYVQFFQDTSTVELKPVINFKENQHRILFKGGFENDTMKIYINNKFYAELKVTSNKSTDNTNKYYDVFCRDQCRVKLLIDNECIDFSFLRDYKLANISKQEGDWYITFSNYYWFSE
ncbi:MAG TPA: hypothetical protein V6C58_19535 [Allocoleopsis sp.]